MPLLKEDQQKLEHALSSENETQLKELVDCYGIDEVAATELDYNLPLFWAVENDKYHALRSLIQQGIDVLNCTSYGYTILHLKLDKLSGRRDGQSVVDDLEKMFEIIPEKHHEALLMMPKKGMVQYDDTLLHRVGHDASAVSEWALKKIAPEKHDPFIMLQNRQKKTALHNAAEWDAKAASMTKLLLRHLSPAKHAEFLALKNESNRTALHIAALHHKEGALKAIIEAASAAQCNSELVSICDKKGQTAFHTMLDKRNEDRYTYSNRTKSAKLIAPLARMIPKEQRVDFLFQQDNEGKSVLDYAFLCEEHAPLQAILTIIPEKDYQRFIHKISPKQQLLIAVSRESDSEIQKIISKTPKTERTALIHTYFHQKQPQELEDSDDELCPTYGATEPEGGVTVIEITAENGQRDLLQFLLKHFKPTQAEKLSIVKKALRKAVENNHTETIKLLLKHIPEKEKNNVIRDSGGRNPLVHLAAEKGYVAIMRQLLEVFPKNKRTGVIKVKSEGGRNALHLAAENGHIAATTQLLTILPVNQRMGFVMEVSRGGKNALHLAAQRGHVGAGQAIFNTVPKSEHFKLITAKEAKKKNLLYIASEANHTSFLAMCLRHIPKGKEQEVLHMLGGPSGGTAMHVVHSSDMIDLLENYAKRHKTSLINHPDSRGRKPITWTMSYCGNITAFIQRGANLANVDLVCAKLGGTDLCGTRFKNANISTAHNAIGVTGTLLLGATIGIGDQEVSCAQNPYFHAAIHTLPPIITEVQQFYNCDATGKITATKKLAENSERFHHLKRALERIAAGELEGFSLTDEQHGILRNCRTLTSKYPLISAKAADKKDFKEWVTSNQKGLAELIYYEAANKNRDLDKKDAFAALPPYVRTQIYSWMYLAPTPMGSIAERCFENMVQTKALIHQKLGRPERLDLEIFYNGFEQELMLPEKAGSTDNRAARVERKAGENRGNEMNSLANGN